MKNLALEDILRFSHAKWDFLDLSCKMRLSQFLMQDETFPISHAGWDFLVFSLKMRFSHILIQDETFPISHAGWDFSVFLCYMRLFVRRMKNKKNTLLRPLHYVLVVKKLPKSPQNNWTDLFIFSFRRWRRNWSTKCYWFFKSYKSLWWPFNFLAQSHQKFWRNWSATFNENIKAKEESISKFAKGTFEK